MYIVCIEAKLASIQSSLTQEVFLLSLYLLLYKMRENTIQMEHQLALFFFFQFLSVALIQLPVRKDGMMVLGRMMVLK